MSTTYIIEMPGKEPREVTNINFDVVEKIVVGAGGKIYPKLKTVVVEPNHKFISETPISLTTFAEPTTTYRWNEVLVIVNYIREKHFADCPKVMSCQIECNYRMRSRLLGRAWSWKNKVELSNRLMNTESHNLHQVIYHEFLHIKFPGQGHRGQEFRYYEKNNPYRRSKNAKRLTCVG